jgi:hypothetical protein
MISRTYLDEFIKLANYYGLVSKEQRKSWKTRLEKMDYEPTREEKIMSFKEKKELENKIKNLEAIKEEESKREVIKLQIEANILKAIEDVRMINMEMQLQDHKEKLEIQKQSGEPIKPEKPPGPMKVWHVPKPSSKENQSFFQSEAKHVCHNCDPNYGVGLREDLKNQVFQPGFGQPTMTLEEFGDKEFARMQIAEKQQAEMAALQKAEEDEGSDKDEASDKKTLKDRHWDDWKDDNPKGSGNTKR